MKLRVLFLFISFSLNIFSQDYFSNRLFIKVRENFNRSYAIEEDSRILKLFTNNKILSLKPVSKHILLSSVYELILEKDENNINLYVKILSQLKELEYVEQVPKYKFFFTPNDPQYSSQWNLAKIQADLAWNLGQGCTQVKIAVTDDGFLMNHEDLVNQWYVNTGEINGNGIDDDGNGYIDDWRGWDAANNDNDPSATAPTNSYFTHGTHVAGIIAAQTHNSLGIASIGYNCKMIPVKIGHSSNSSLTGALQGLDYAINASGCDVINMSWGGGGWSATYQTMFDIAKSKGIICVAAAGNSNADVSLSPIGTPMYPAAYNHVISVAASASNDARASFSNYGNTIDVTAPGVNILSCLAGATNSYGSMSGTSMASPLVAGLCALMKCYNPMPVDSIESCLKRTCDNINTQNPSYIGKLGAGRINAFQALQCLTKKPKSDFIALDTFQCIGKSVHYAAKSFGIPTLTYNWSFPGGSPATSTLQNPVIIYSNNGWKSTTLITCNSLGCDTITKTNLVNIDTPKASLLGRKYTSYNANPIIITVKFMGNPPYSFTLTDGTNNWTQSNIKTNPYFFSIVPQKDTSHITISSFSDSSCVGNKYGRDSIYRLNLSGGGNALDCDTSNLNTGKVLHLDFNGNTQDKSGNGNHATNFGATPVAGKDGVSNTAYRFDSMNYMSVAHHASLNLRSFTMTAILKPNKFNTNLCYGNCIIAKGANSQPGQWAFIYGPADAGTTCVGRDTTLNNYLFCGNTCVSSWYIPDTPRMKSGKWDCVAFTYDSLSKSAKIYVDGKLRHQWTTTWDLLTNQNTANLLIGMFAGINYPYYLQATIDDIRIYKRVLAPSEVKGYCGICNLIPPVQDCDTNNLNTGKVLHLDFNGNTQDKSGLGNHATNYGATPVAGKNGIANTAYRFNGTSNYMQIVNSASLNNFSGNKITMTAILKPRGFYNGTCMGNSIIVKGNADYVTGNYLLRYSANNGCSSFGDTNQNNFETAVSSAGGCSVSQVHNPPFVNRDSWYCVVGVYTGDSIILYVNGTLRYACSYSGGIGSYNMDVFIGKLDNATFPYWLNADVDDIRIYNRALAPSEVKGYCGTCNTLPTSSDCDTTNLVQNNQFNFGNSGFISDYTFCNSNNCLWSLFSDGYSVASDASLRHNLFVGNGYGGSGNFAIYNGGLSNLRAWEQNVSVLPNKSYKFSVWLSSVYTINPAPLSLYVNNSLISSKTAPTILNNWIELSGVWSSGSNTNATITIKCTNTSISNATNGTDFGLDNISFKQLCTQLPPINCDTSSHLSYTQCLNDSLQVNLRQGSQYRWSPKLGLSSDTIANPKIYVHSNQRYLVSYIGLRGCQVMDTIDISVKPPAIYPKLEHQLICIGDSVQMTISIFATDIVWSPNLFISSTTAKNPYFFPTTNRTYYLEFRDSLGCLQRDTFVINTKVCCPARARFTIPKEILCFGEKLFVTNTSKGSITSTNWSFGNALPATHIGVNPPALSFPSGGTYPIRLIVSNGSCYDTMEKYVSVIQLNPNAGRDTNNCLAAFSTHLGDYPISDWMYSWTPTKYLNDPNIANPICTIINDSVRYVLEVTDRNSGCKGYDTVLAYTNRNIDSNSTYRRICKVDFVNFNGKKCDTAGTYFFTLKKSDGICDSFIDILYLNVLTPTIRSLNKEIRCNYYIDRHGKRFDSSFVYFDTIKSISIPNCDSLIDTFRVEIFKKIYKKDKKSGCAPVRYNGKKYNISKTNADSIVVKGSYSGCDSIITYIDIEVFPSPVAKITASKANPILYKDTVRLTASGGKEYIWLPLGPFDSILDYKLNVIDKKIFSVLVKNEFDCIDTAEYEVEGMYPDTCYYGIPNVFSPNGDNVNDVFIPNMDECTELVTFMIFDRWGEKVFETNKYEGWNGVYKGKPAPMAVYVYYLELKNPWGLKKISGSFTLVR